MVLVAEKKIHIEVIIVADFKKEQFDINFESLSIAQFDRCVSLYISEYATTREPISFVDLQYGTIYTELCIFINLHCLNLGIFLFTIF